MIIQEQADSKKATVVFSTIFNLLGVCVVIGRSCIKYHRTVLCGFSEEGDGGAVRDVLTPP